ncbi:hypothetical protein M0811_12097 [Anaeramoeba ignava]|uniref:Uncharacterized protein n=1 Tax=Anaeramoeba ignava TaxID=1746090 RepID=A0A9Q0LBJ6_ANAIG|nr:hypothetical protein M0811_12097 [Anaeramoeba ignava]
MIIEETNQMKNDLHSNKIEYEIMILNSMPIISPQQIIEWINEFKQISFFANFQLQENLQKNGIKNIPESELPKLKITESHLFYADYNFSIFDDSLKLFLKNKTIQKFGSKKNKKFEKEWLLDYFDIILTALNTSINLACGIESFTSIINDSIFNQFSKSLVLKNITSSFDSNSQIQNINQVKILLVWLEMRLETKRILQIKAEKISLKHTKNISSFQKTDLLLKKMKKLHRSQKRFRKILLDVSSQAFLLFIKNLYLEKN